MDSHYIRRKKTLHLPTVIVSERSRSLCGKRRVRSIQFTRRIKYLFIGAVILYFHGKRKLCKKGFGGSSVIQLVHDCVFLELYGNQPACTAVLFSIDCACFSSTGFSRLLWWFCILRHSIAVPASGQSKYHKAEDK